MLRLLLLLIIISNYIFADAHVFVYHRFGDNRYPSTSTTLADLRKQFEFFKQNGYEVVPLSSIVQKIKNKEEVPSNWVALTIDDSFKTFYTNGLPIFKEYKYPFTLFVYVKATNEKYKDFMTWDDVREAKKYGDVQLHTYEHPHLVSLKSEDVRLDVAKGQEIFEKEMGYKSTMFAYPFGEYDTRVRDIVKSYGFETIFKQSSGAVNVNSPLDELDRVPLVGSGIELKTKLALKALNANFIEPIDFPKDGMIKDVKITIPNEIKKAQIFINEIGKWQQVDVEDGKINLQVNKQINSKKSKIIVLVNNKISTKILIKGEE